jgi:hypothetical protein
VSEQPDFFLSLAPRSEPSDVAYPDAVGVMVKVNESAGSIFKPIVEWKDWGMQLDGTEGWRSERTTHLSNDRIKAEKNPPRASQDAGYEYYAGLRFFWDNYAGYGSGPFSRPTTERRDARQDAEDALRRIKTSFGFVMPTKGETFRIISDLNNDPKGR